MYEKILVALENSQTDKIILRHIEPLVKLLGSKVVLVHVADGWAARQYNNLKLTESDEMKADRAYLEQVSAYLREEGISAEAQLLLGDPADQIAKLARESKVDLIAMSTHGHRFIGDLLYGSTAEKIRHTVDVPVLLLKAPK